MSKTLQGIFSCVLAGLMAGGAQAAPLDAVRW